MNTFLAYPSFSSSAQVLDDRRLGSQRRECIQLLLALWYPERKHYDVLWRELGYKTCDPVNKRKAAYINHPCTAMWRGYENALLEYLVACCVEWDIRGHSNERANRFLAVTYTYTVQRTAEVLPPWFGDEDFHSRHRAALLFKDPYWYGQWDWTEEPKMDYRWG